MSEPLFDTDANEPSQPGYDRSTRKTWTIAVLLFLATCGSTFLAGMGMGEQTAETTYNDMLWDGFSYAGPVMLILLCHEMGHFLAACYHRVPASPPFFLPLPLFSPLGTLGAVIVQQRGFGDRRALFDIAVAGPLAGVVVAIPVAWFGVQQSRLIEFEPTQYAITFGDPLLMKAMIWAKFGDLPANHDVWLNPLLFAGWAGLFLTGLNLVPIGQLDGGHIVYGLVGRYAHRVSTLFLAGGIVFMAYNNEWSYLLMIILLVLTGVRHPPTTNDAQPLGRGRTLLGWATLSLFFVCFTPFPITINSPNDITPPALMDPEPEAAPKLPSVAYHTERSFPT